jgi:hypothetical protein
MEIFGVVNGLFHARTPCRVPIETGHETPVDNSVVNNVVVVMNEEEFQRLLMASEAVCVLIDTLMAVF